MNPDASPEPSERAAALGAATRAYLEDVLLPFWIERAPDAAGGFLSHFDATGRPTGVTAKTFLMQVRLLFSFSQAHRAGYGGGRCAELAERGADFLIQHYHDAQHGGWFWSADRDGTPTDRRKIGYGQCFAMYAFGEYFLATGDARGRDAMLETFDVVQRKMLDPTHGGYFEIMEQDWRPGPPGRGGGDRKSFDVHMHMMEALTKVYEVTAAPDHRGALLDVIDLLVRRMLDPVHRTGIQQFALDFSPQPAIRFDVAWGRDEDPASGSIPTEITSYGHNVEFAWLLLQTAAVLGVPPADYRNVVLPQFEHCLLYGIDRERGGVYIDGPAGGPPPPDHAGDKQFWQQAEVLVGMLAAWELTGDARFFRAFESVYGFVFTHFVNRPAGGEWFHKVDREGTPIEDHLGDHYKISYHTVRAMIEVVARLERSGA